MGRQRLNALKQMHTAKEQTSPLQKALFAFLQASSDDEARKILAQSDILLTIDARRILDQFQGADNESQRQIEARKALWQHEYQKRHESHDPSLELQRLTEQATNTQMLSSNIVEQSKYNIVTAVMCAIGDGAVTINNIGRIPLAGGPGKHVG